jgi:hypothetical protein
MKRTPVDSSAIAAIGYEPREEVLEIEFTSGAVYRYLDVPYAVYSELIEAESHGRAFAQLVRYRWYVYWRVG